MASLISFTQYSRVVVGRAAVVRAGSAAEQVPEVTDQ
jgi:hypothetical protein